MMPDRFNRYHKNIPGAFYVDNTCIRCDVCVQVAEKHFKLDSDNEEHAFVYAQPKTEEEKMACQEAIENCPIEAIGDDGD